MNKNNLFLYFSAFLMHTTLVLADCPTKGAMNVCRCEDDNIYCGGTKDIDLVKIFANLSNNLVKSQKKFKLFYLNNKLITELAENTFKDILFDEIDIESAVNLSKINKNAFNGTDSVTKRIKITSDRKLTNTDNSLFDSLNKFSNLEELQLLYINLTAIPSNAFQSLNKLRKIEFRGNQIRSIGEKAFKALVSLQTLSISETRINRLPDNVFAFDKPSNQTLIIELISNAFMNSFAKNSLSDIKRPTVLRFGSAMGFTPNQITYLDENIFMPFLSANDNNSLDLYGQYFDCNDCRSYWLSKQPKLSARLLNLKCQNGKPFNDSNNFNKCKN